MLREGAAAPYLQLFASAATFVRILPRVARLVVIATYRLHGVAWEGKERSAIANAPPLALKARRNWLFRRARAAFAAA